LFFINPRDEYLQLGFIIFGNYYFKVMRIISFISLVITMSFLFIACNSTAVDSEKNADTEENITPEKSNAEDKTTNNEQKPSGDNRLRIEKDLNGHQTVLILNAPMVASKGFTDFYLKVGELPHKDITVSSITKQGLVSKNKEEFYFSVKPTEGSTEIDLNIIIAEKGKERYEIGKLNLPINN